MHSETLKQTVRSLQFWTLLGFALTVPFSKALANIFIGATAVAWLLQCVLERRVIFPKTPFNWLIVLFVMSLFLSFIETNHLDMSFRGIRKIVERFGLFFLALQALQTNQKLERFISLLGFGYGIILLSGFCQMVLGHDFIRGRELRYVNQMPRITSSFEYPDQYGIYLIYTVFLFGFCAFIKNLPLWKKLYFSAVSVAGVISLFFTHSRAAWVSFFAALVISTLFTRKALLTFLITVTALFFIFMALPSDVLIHKDAEGKEQSVSERFTLWSRALEVIKVKPIFGIGINTYGIESEKYRKDDKDNLAQYYAHNSYLQMAAESGLVTAGLYLVLVGAILLQGYRALRKEVLSLAEQQVLKAVLAGTIGFLVLNCFETSLFSVQPAQIYYFFLAIMCYLILKANPSNASIKKTGDKL